MTTESRTSFAMAAMDFAGMFNAFFSEKSIAGFVPELTSPEGQSTGGGKQARQHITLNSMTDDKSLVMGYCNNVEKKAELRSFDYVADQYKKRYQGETFPVGRKAYDGLLQHLKNFFSSQSLAVSVAADRPARAAAPAPAAKTGKSSTGLIIGVAVGVLVVVAVLVYFLVLNKS